MKVALSATVIALAAAAFATSPADAKVCLKGAAIGGVGGHFVGRGHGMAGAAVGCAIGHHHAKVAARKAAMHH